MDKVLCIDDDAGMLALYRALAKTQRFAAHQFRLETAANAAQGLAAVAERGPFAVVLTDMRMPGTNGLQFLSSVRQIAPDTVRVMITGHADLPMVLEAVNEGNIFRFLTK